MIWLTVGAIYGAGYVITGRLLEGHPTALAWFGIKVLGDQPELLNDPAALIAVLKTKSYYLIGFAVVIAVLYAIMIWMQKRARRSASH